MKQYPRTVLQQSVVIDRIVSLYYFEFAKDFVFPGEEHDFWEFLYIDKGEVTVRADETLHLLKQGSIIFHKPNEFHSIYANRVVAPNLIVMSFECHSDLMKMFENKIIRLGDEERNLLAEIVREGMNAFHFPFRIPLQRRADAPVGSEQLIKLYLETFLLRLLRKEQSRRTIGESVPIPLSSTAKENKEAQMVRDIISYLEGRLGSKLSLAEMSETLHMSKTKLKELFKRRTGYSLMEYFGQLRIDRAKSYIREESANFTEIADRLGFSSVHYFSKAFKKTTGMSPTEYAKSVKARVPVGKI
nr:AraC family transcriptional regulator [Aneurinibacillus sp. XH2]